jgi:hypothetical protein
MHLFKEHGVRDHQAAAGQIPVIDYGPYFAGASGALQRLLGRSRISGLIVLTGRSKTCSNFMTGLQTVSPG